MKTLVVMSRKGGTGKTTVAVNLAVEAQARGLRVLLLDVDPQRSAGEWARLRRGRGPAVQETSGGKLYMTRLAAERSGLDLLIVDTPCAPEAETLQAVALADLCLVVTRPSFLDIAAAAHSAEAVRRLGRRGVVVLSQAPSARQGAEHPMVLKALEAIRFTGWPTARAGLRARADYQAAVAQGASVAEYNPRGTAAREIATLFDDLAARLDLPRPALAQAG